MDNSLNNTKYLLYISIGEVISNVFNILNNLIVCYLLIISSVLLYILCIFRFLKLKI